jgi:uncharacterized protein YndB with AHSA1/START domain
VPDILHRLNIRTTPERAYAALATVEGIRAWWTRDAQLEPRVGGRGEFGFFDRRVVTSVTVEALEPPRRVAWRTVASNAPGGWDGTTIGFELGAIADGTVVAFTHRGFREADEDYARVTTGWAYYLFSLRLFLETGVGGPNPDADFTRGRR